MKRGFRFFFKFILWFVILSVAWVLLYRVVPVSYTPLMAIQKYQSEEIFEIQHQWKSIDEISPMIQLAVICSEDQNFLIHKGFDIEAIKKAYKNNQDGKRLRGGSTISQQTAKNVFLWPKRNWVRKGLETWFTFLIETLWNKQRILEVYLNSIEMGEGVYGIEMASQHWFHTSAQKINREQAAAIAAILPNPRTYKATPATQYISKRKSWIVNQMRNYGTFTIKEAKNDPIRSKD